MKDLDTTKEALETVKSVSETTSKALDVTEKFGGFIAQYVGGSLEQAMGIFEDKLKYLRWERQLRLIARVEELAKDHAVEISKRPIPLKMAIPLFEAASLEEEDYLQDLWAKLLLNASNAQSKVNLHRSYINILEQITSLEAKILKTIYDLEFSVSDGVDIATSKLPEEAHLEVDFDAINPAPDSIVDPIDDVKAALANLARLRCLALPTSFNGKEIFHHVNPTLLGRRFVDACSV
ncbi:Abi-alpha family protein [Pseudodesulfovibrio sediminis]|uniref:DUF4393 domain-containing protein n=1 Tax=Pseudodesulfovibrio sediminis TaxID=2810563 RepID=A0ABN6ELC4_9BACT|nr:Abi-alpha family protein [Pseudodesulfovibrio sediminis]BCS86828.1 hypothetical protein PSDVSF_00700 [Pseudodesulfovibrio sediminis]